MLKDDGVNDYISHIIDSCIENIKQNQSFRRDAFEYYNGNLPDLPPAPYRSKIVCNDLRDKIRDILPTTVRAFFKNNNFVKYESNSPEFENEAEQASLYINRFVLKDCSAETAIYDAVFDAMLYRTGFLKWQAVKNKSVEFYSFEAKKAEDILPILDDTVEVVEQTDNSDGTFDFKIKKTILKTDVFLKSVPRDSFLIFQGVETINESPVVGDIEIMTRSDLVAMGFDKSLVNELTAHEFNATTDGDDLNKDNNLLDANVLKKESEYIEIFNLYLKLDLDGDGVSEIYYYCVAKGGESSQGYTVLRQEPHYEYPYAPIVVERESHQLEGRSLSEDIMPLMKINTSIMREAMDNLKWVNNPQKVVNASGFDVARLNELANPNFGQPLIVKNVEQMDSVRFIETPFIADKAFAVMEVVKNQIDNRTGVTKQAGALDPNNLSNVTQIAIESLNAPALAQSEMMLRNISVGLERVFEGVLKLVIQFSPEAVLKKVDTKWVNFTPSAWDSNMRCVVTVGYGAGGRKEDMQLLNTILSYQKEIMTLMGAENPLVGVNEVYETLQNLILAAGLSSITPYFKSPKDAPPTEAQPEKPSDLEIKMQFEKQIKQMQLEHDIKIEEAQRQADISVRKAEFEKEYALQLQKLEFEKQKSDMEMSLDLKKHNDEMVLKKSQQAIDVTQSLRQINNNADFTYE